MDNRIESFDSGLHLESVNDWLSKRGLPGALLADLPSIGFVAYECGEPIAAAFLRRCEGGVGIFDSLVADPSQTLAARNRCIDFLIGHVLEAAKTAGINRVIAFTINSGVFKRAKRFGFEKKPYAVLSLKIT